MLKFYFSAFLLFMAIILGGSENPTDASFYATKTIAFILIMIFFIINRKIFKQQ